MKNALVMILTMASVAAFAGEHKNVKKIARKEAIETCKAEGKSKVNLKACVKEKLSTPVQATK